MVSLPLANNLLLVDTLYLEVNMTVDMVGVGQHMVDGFGDTLVVLVGQDILAVVVVGRQ